MGRECQLDIRVDELAAAVRWAESCGPTLWLAVAGTTLPLLVLLVSPVARVRGAEVPRAARA